MIEVLLNDHEIAQAWDWSQEIERNLRGENYTKVQAENRYFIGTLGETAFAKLLVAKGIKGEWHRRTDGLSGKTDFTVYRYGELIRLDAKTASKGYYAHLMIPLEQFDKETEVDYYVGCRMQGLHLIEVIGVESRKAMEPLAAVMRKCPTKEVHLDTLVAIEHMLKGLDAGELVVVDESVLLEAR